MDLEEAASEAAEAEAQAVSEAVGTMEARTAKASAKAASAEAAVLRGAERGAERAAAARAPGTARCSRTRLWLCTDTREAGVGSPRGPLPPRSTCPVLGRARREGGELRYRLHKASW